MPTTNHTIPEELLRLRRRVVELERSLKAAQAAAATAQARAALLESRINDGWKVASWGGVSRHAQ